MRQKRIVALAVVLVIVAAALAWLVVPGRWAPGLAQLTADSVVTVSRYQHMDWENRAEYTLTDQQVEQLRQLMEETVFVRRLTSGIRSHVELTHYDVLVEAGHEGGLVCVECSFGSGDYVTVIENGVESNFIPLFPEWRENMEGILNQ